MELGAGMSGKCLADSIGNPDHAITPRGYMPEERGSASQKLLAAVPKDCLPLVFRQNFISQIDPFSHLYI